MILVDSSVWIDHLRHTESALAAFLNRAQVLCHPFIVGELALSKFRQLAEIIRLLQGLPAATIASDSEVLDFIDRYGLHGRGIGYIDAHLLASVRLSADTALWTRDIRLHAAASDLGIAVKVAISPAPARGGGSLPE